AGAVRRDGLTEGVIDRHVREIFTGAAGGTAGRPVRCDGRAAMEARAVLERRALTERDGRRPRRGARPPRADAYALGSAGTGGEGARARDGAADQRAVRDDRIVEAVPPRVPAAPLPGTRRLLVRMAEGQRSETAARPGAG